MFNTLARCALFSLLLLPSAEAAEPVKLTLAYFSSDREQAYVNAIKPFVDAVNAKAKGVIEIQVYPSGALGRDFAQQAQMVLDGIADIAWINPGLTPNLFPDNTVIELPGLFRDAREATLAYTRVVASGAMKGFENFFVVAAIGTEPLSIHARFPIDSLKDLAGKKIRSNNPTEGAVLSALGMIPEVMPINQTSEAIGRGMIDGATSRPGSLAGFGISRVTNHHYFLNLGAAPLLILMNRKKFDSLPQAGQDVIREYSGEWMAARYIEEYAATNDPILEKLKSDPKRAVTFPSKADLDKAQAAFKKVIDEWLAEDPRHPKLLAAVQTQIAKLRTPE
jgi:TRAP-type C4-dicarboxylate transport system substrate-binding protein